MKQANTLYIVATPIGNLNDITMRALETLRTVNFIAAEDTRHSSKLMKQYAITTPLFALHEHNEQQASVTVLDRLKQGECAALISDAGTPLISDPGRRLVQQALEQGVKVVPIPGASALVSALSVAGLAADQFVFEGFLPPKDQHRRQRLSKLLMEERTMAFYEAPHRIKTMLVDCISIFGVTRHAVLAKELTKVFEAVISGPLPDLLAWLEADQNRMQGEFVVVIAGAEKSVDDDSLRESERILKILMSELPSTQAVNLTAKITGVRKNYLYKLSLS